MKQFFLLLKRETISSSFQTRNRILLFLETARCKPRLKYEEKVDKKKWFCLLIASNKQTKRFELLCLFTLFHSTSIFKRTLPLFKNKQFIFKLYFESQKWLFYILWQLHFLYVKSLAKCWNVLVSFAPFLIAEFTQMQKTLTVGSLVIYYKLF